MKTKIWSSLVLATLAFSTARAQDEATDVSLEQAPPQDFESSMAPLPEMNSTGAISQPVKRETVKKKNTAKKKKKKKAKKKASISTSRSLASVGSNVGGEIAYVVPVGISETIPVVETDVFGERTSFEQMILTKAAAAGRKPAGLKASARVIAVRRELGLTRAQADQAPQDLILNGGEKAGLDKGMTLSLVRRVPILDPYRENQQSELEVEYGQVRIVHVQGEPAVARVEKLDSIREGLGLSIRGPLVGDFVGSR